MPEIDILGSNKHWNVFFSSRTQFCTEGLSLKRFLRKILKIEFQSILALIFLCKSCVNLADFIDLENLDFVNSWGFLEFLKLRMIHLKLGICRIEHYLNFCQMNYRNFASKQKFAFLKKYWDFIDFQHHFTQDLQRKYL